MAYYLIVVFRAHCRVRFFHGIHQSLFLLLLFLYEFFSRDKLELFISLIVHADLTLRLVFAAHLPTSALLVIRRILRSRIMVLSGIRPCAVLARLRVASLLPVLLSLVVPLDRVLRLIIVGIITHLPASLIPGSLCRSVIIILLVLQLVIEAIRGAKHVKMKLKRRKVDTKERLR